MTGLTGFLTKKFVPGYENPKDPAARQRCGAMSGRVGIFLNLCLSAGKFVAGTLSGSLSMTADALNNLTDAASSVVTLVGFRMAGHKADEDHPFGHGRAEYVSGLIVSLIILLVGFELGKSSVEKLLHPTPLTFSWVAVGVLAASILVKLWMWRFNRSLSRYLNSEALAATAADSLSDSIATTVVLLGAVASRFSSLPIDGFLGLLVALFILRSGYGAAKDTLDPLLGRPADPALVEEIQKSVLESPFIVGIHDLVIHDYGPGRVMATLHAEVPMDADFLAAHDAIDAVERRLRETCHVETVIHMDPIATNDARVTELRRQVAQIAQDIHPGITIHDFRMTDGPLHTNLIFDAVKPFDCSLSDQELVDELNRRLSTLPGRYYAVVEVDRPLSGN